MDKVCEIAFLSAQVAVTANNVRRLQPFEDDQPDCTLLALHPPDDPAQGVEVNMRPLVRHQQDKD